MLNRPGQDVILLIDVITLDPTVDESHVLLCAIGLIFRCAPGRGFGEDNVNDEHESDVAPLGVDRGAEVVGVVG